MAAGFEIDATEGDEAGPVADRRSRFALGSPLRLRLKRDSWPDVALGGVLAVATFFVHNVGYMLSLPFWTDEAWVAISTRLPLGQLAKVTASTPIGWSLLLRFVFFGGQQGLRMVPLMFAALAVLAAYVYVRSLPWPSVSVGRLAAVLAGCAALMMPSALARDDLKQYTADAFVTLLILWLTSRLESVGTRRRLIALAVVPVIGFLFSAVSVFVGAAAFGSMVLIALSKRNWRRAREVAIAGACAGVLMVAIFLWFYRPGLAPGLQTYWAYYYLPIEQGWGSSWEFLAGGGRNLASFAGLGSWAVGLLLVAAGVLTLVRLKCPALAITVPALLVEMIALGALKQYPLFDLRTSHFLTMALGVTAAIGVGGLCALVARLHPSVAAVAAAIVVALFIANVRVGIRAEVIDKPAPLIEDLRTPTNYVAAHQQANDIIVLNALSSWGFAYYWDRGTPVIEPVTSNLQGFLTVFPDQPNIIVATDRTASAVDDVMTRASAIAAKLGPTARIWFIHQHTTEAERGLYAAAINARDLQVQTVMTGELDLLTLSPTS
jgi:hypothetical protein